MVRIFVYRIALRAQHGTLTCVDKHRQATATARAWDEQLGANILDKLWNTEHMKS